MKHPPDWIKCPLAREFYAKHAPKLISDGLLNELTETSYGLLSVIYSDFRNSENIRERNKSFDNYTKLATKFGLIPHIQASRTLTEQAHEQHIDPALASLRPKPKR